MTHQTLGNRLTLRMAFKVSRDEQGSLKDLRLQSFVLQSDTIWPKENKHIMAQYDDDSIIVYQAYCPEIADYAVKNQR